ncbi:MAG: bifunctional demethylmenaquinone methyltransferase/2-methoxy-6-polyprenyl-1,4-benzoquinol methylase UbiE [Burkholderiaceae bacterium]
MSDGDKFTHFGFDQVNPAEKAGRVGEVFSSVARRYDVMNDLMSAGMHRVWKAFTLSRAVLRPGMKVLDVAGGTADMSKGFARRVGSEGQVWLTDINESMLRIGRDRMLDEGYLQPALQCDAERLPFPDAYFDRVCVAFGLRNMTDKQAALAEMYRVIRPSGKLLVLEFSRVIPALEPFYDAYSFEVLPRIGELVTQDADSYRYLAESIRMHPDQETLADMMRTAGFARVMYTNLTAGVVALHEGTVV